MALDYLRQYVRQPAPASRGEEAGADVAVAGMPRAPIGDDPTSGAITEWSAGHRHGRHQLGDLVAVQGRGLVIATGDDELAYADLSRAVFLDTETTGLSTGTGTYVFLVGAGYWEDGALRVRQFFLRSPGDEPAFLVSLFEFLSRFSVLVTFNGKAFDWPLLESRFVRDRILRRAPLQDPPHIDLLHPARRLWKRRLASCALSSLEEHVLGVRRTHDDVPGWLIPSLYFKYLRTDDAAPLHGVFYHNLMDILSLVTLTIHVDRVLNDPHGGMVDHSTDFLSLGRLFQRAGDTPSAIACYEGALRGDLGNDVVDEARLRLAGMYKRERRWEAALTLWDQIIDAAGPSRLYALIERSKYHEHVERSYLEALDDVRFALQILDFGSAQNTPIERHELEHRQGRLVNRVFRDRSWKR